MKTALVLAAMLAVDDPLVERPGPGQAPTAFRIWAAGENRSDDGSIFFTQASADMLMAEQEARGRVYSSDFDHLSILPDRPAESGRASGWHRLAVRPNADGEPELWAVEIEWCEDAKAGLEADPPRWRFFSPAFRRDTDSGEVKSYINFALCINPLTHGLPSLASETAEKTTMLTKEQCAAHFAKMNDPGASEEDKTAARAALAEFFESGDDEKKDEKEGKSADSVAEPGEGSEAAQQAETTEKAAAGEGDEEKVEKKATLAMAADLAAKDRRIDKLEIDGLLRDRPDLPESLRTWCATQSLATVKSFLKSSPKSAVSRNAVTVQGDGAGKPVGLQGADLEALNKGMGIRTAPEKQFERSSMGELVIHNIGPTRAREERAAQQRAGGNGK